MALLAAAALAGCTGDGSDTASPTTGPTSTAPGSPTGSPASPAPTSSAPSPTDPTGPTSTPVPTAISSAPAPTCTIPSALRGEDLEKISASRKIVALTFDAGANADAVPSILATLAAEDVPGTFFLTGRFVEDFPAESRQIAQRYVVGNHSMTHPDLTTLSGSQVRAELTRAERIIRNTTGEDPRRFFRFPLGARDARTIGIVNDLCYVAFRWTVDTLGWQGTSGGMSVSKVVNRVLAAATPGEIVLMHVGSHPGDGSTLDADALPQIIDGLRDRGYQFVSLTEVLPAAP